MMDDQSELEYELTVIFEDLEEGNMLTAYELADELQDLHGLYCEDAANMLRQQADRIAELEKELQRINANAEFELDRAYNTPQIKELSDEEIQSIWNEGIVGWYATQEESVLKFARAILKKASEK